jgi:ring-1,2-phenylacetyl-CoA epoxidase subunit PaaD
MKNPSPGVAEVYDWLEGVKDPEIPVISLVDLGVITHVEISGDQVKVEMTPTFVGCPAMDYMKNDVVETLKKHGIKDPVVTINFKHGWSSDKISPKGRAALKSFGLAPPPPTREIHADLNILEHTRCPRCNGTNTEMESPFGPTLCRSLHYCNDCREAFEQFKPLETL